MVISTGFLTRSAAVAVLGTGLLGLAPAAVYAAPADGYVRLAHLSPDTPAVDVYLYSTGSASPKLVLRHVAYGTLSPYQRLGSGSYSVAMRPADAAAASKPVLSTTVKVRAGQSYTVAGMGPYKGITLKILHDTVSLPAGRAGLRIIQASAKQPTVTVTTSGQAFADGLRFPASTPYRPLPTATTSMVQVTGSSGSPTSTEVPLPAGSVHTIVVLDGSSGLKLLDLSDTAEGATTPRGGTNTGLGGLAPHRAAGVTSYTGTLVAALAGIVATLGLARLRRRRTRA